MESQISSTTLTMTSGAESSVIFNNDNGLDSTARLDGVVITGGRGNPHGGGILNFNSNPSLVNCVISGNSASDGAGRGDGGGIANLGGNPSTTFNNTTHLVNCVISGNSADDGAGISNFFSTLSLVNCVISGNKATGAEEDGHGSGGAIFNSAGQTNLINCVISGNSANNSGGGVVNALVSFFNIDLRSFSSMVNCIISGNSASVAGGGILNYFSCSPTLTNCVLSSNTAGFGGGIVNYSRCSPTLTNCVLSSNTANFGGGIYNILDSNPVLVNCSLTANRSEKGIGAALYNNNSQPQLTNTILWNNQGTTAITNDNSNVTASYCLFDASVTGYTGPNNLTATSSPFVSATDYQLSPCSVAINAGDPTSTTAISGSTDLAGNPRFYNSRIDMGAYEFQGTPLAITQQPPAASAVCPGANLTIPVSITGSATAFQWYKNNSPLSSQTSATLTLTNIQPADAGSYSLVITGNCNSLTSNAFSLTVNPTPTASLTNNGPLSPTLTTVTLTANGGVSYAFSAGANQPGGPTSNSASVTQPGTYSVLVTSANGCTASAQTTVTGSTNQTVCRGATALITVTASGSGLTYQWYKNGQTIANKMTEIASIQKGTTTTSLTLINNQTSANYYLKATDGSGNFTWYGPFQVVVNFNCTARLATESDGLSGLQIVVAPNPLQNNHLKAVITGAGGRLLTVELMNLWGQPLYQQQWESAGEEQAVDWDLSTQSSGTYVLQAQTIAGNASAQRQTIKLIKP